MLVDYEDRLNLFDALIFLPFYRISTRGRSLKKGDSPGHRETLIKG